MAHHVSNSGFSRIFPLQQLNMKEYKGGYIDLDANNDVKLLYIVISMILLSVLLYYFSELIMQHPLSL